MQGHGGKMEMVDRCSRAPSVHQHRLAQPSLGSKDMQTSRATTTQMRSQNGLHFHLLFHILPSPHTILAQNQTPLPGTIITKHTKHKLPSHNHNNIHLSLSNKFFLKAS